MSAVARHPLYPRPVPPAPPAAASSKGIADEFVGDRPSRRQRATKRKTICDSAWDKALVQAESMMASGEWEGAIARNFVALYALCHRKVYGVEPAELTPGERVHAAAAAQRMLDAEFDGDVVRLVTFIRWTWRREREREEWRRANGRGGTRIGWRLQFNCTLLTDYRLAVARRLA